MNKSFIIMTCRFTFFLLFYFPAAVLWIFFHFILKSLTRNVIQVSRHEIETKLILPSHKEDGWHKPHFPYLQFTQIKKEVHVFGSSLSNSFCDHHRRLHFEEKEKERQDSCKRFLHLSFWLVVDQKWVLRTHHAWNWTAQFYVIIYFYCSERNRFHSSAKGMFSFPDWNDVKNRRLLRRIKFFHFKNRENLLIFQ